MKKNISEKIINLSPAQLSSGAHDANQPSPKVILKHIFEDGYIDDHDHLNGLKETKAYKPNVAVIRIDIRNGAVEVCAAFENTAFCINPFYYDEEDGMVHLSTVSVGGSINTRMYRTIDDAIAYYNREQLMATFASEQLVLVRKDEFMVGSNAYDELTKSMSKTA